MDRPRDAGGFTMPPTPSTMESSPPRRPSMARYSDAGASGISHGSFALRHSGYRQSHLAYNNIYIRHPDTSLPLDLAAKIKATVRARQDSPALSSDVMTRVLYQLGIFASRGCNVNEMAAFLDNTIFPDPINDPVHNSATGLMRTSNIHMEYHLVPKTNDDLYNLPCPKPSMLYGYSADPKVFAEPHIQVQWEIRPGFPCYTVATKEGLRFPFFAIEIKAAVGGQGDLYVAVNQCAGASASCLNAIGELNSALQKCGSKHRVDNLSYSIAVDNNMAQLFVTWKENELKYYVQRINIFLLTHPGAFQNFRAQVRNILDWGKGTHLEQIKKGLDILLEYGRKRNAERAKSRPPPSDAEAGAREHKSRKISNTSNSPQDQTQALDSEPASFATGTLRLPPPFDKPLGGSYIFPSKNCQPPFPFRPLQPRRPLRPLRPRPAVETDNHTAQRINDNGPVPEHHDLENGQQVSPSDERPGATDEYWTWDMSRMMWFHVNKDGSCEWYEGPHGGSHKWPAPSE